MADLEKIGTEIHVAIAALEKAAKLLEPPTKEEKKLSLEAVRGILADKSRDGFTEEIRSLLQKYGAEKLSKLKPEHYSDLLKEVEWLTHAK